MKKIHIQIFTALFFLMIFFSSGLAYGDDIKKEIQWKEVTSFSVDETHSIPVLYFDGANYSQSKFGFLPYFSELIKLDKDWEQIEVSIEEISYAALDYEEQNSIIDSDYIKDSVSLDWWTTYAQREAFLQVELFPFRINPSTGQIEKVISFKLNYSGKGEKQNNRDKIYKTKSILDSGSWTKIAVSETGIHKISYEDFEIWGIDPQSVNPKKNQLYGNGSGMLPESNYLDSPDDLEELAIQVVGEEDGSFDQGDYILFFGESQVKWNYNLFLAKYEHKTNLYDDKTYYFLNIGQDDGKRIQAIVSTNQPATDTSRNYDDFIVHELDEINLTKSGKDWYGETFDAVNTTQEYQFNIPDINAGSLAWIRLSVAAKSTERSTFTVSNNENYITELSVSAIAPTSITVYARKGIIAEYFELDSDLLNIKLEFDAPVSTSKVWLNFFELNIIRLLKFDGGEIDFRDRRTTGRNRPIMPTAQPPMAARTHNGDGTFPDMPCMDLSRRVSRIDAAAESTASPRQANISRKSMLNCRWLKAIWLP